MSELAHAAGMGLPPQRLPIARGKVKRNLHIVAAVVLAVAALAGLALQGTLGAKSAGTKSDASAQREAMVEVHPEPQLAALQGEISRQQESAGQKPGRLPERNATSAPLDTELKVNLPQDILEGKSAAKTDAEMHKYEVEKQNAVIAGSRILAINKTAAWPGESLPQQGKSREPPEEIVEEPHNSVLPDLKRVANSIRGQLGDGQARGNGEHERVREDREWLSSKQLEADGVSAGRRALVVAEPPRSRYTIGEGTIIPCVLLTQISSDLPGLITAQVSEDVYDSIRGKFLLIPKGSRAVGEYNSSISGGQESIMAAFSRLIFPNGASVNIGATNGTDLTGQSGMRDEVNNHFWKRFGSQLLTAGLARIFQRSDGSVTIINAGGTAPLADAAGQILVDTSRSALSRNFAIPPTIVIKKGYPFNILVNRDMELDPRITATRAE